jgi:hypothetical protein
VSPRRPSACMDGACGAPAQQKVKWSCGARWFRFVLSATGMCATVLKGTRTLQMRDVSRLERLQCEPRL